MKSMTPRSQRILARTAGEQSNGAAQSASAFWSFSAAASKFVAR
jgi:hypothetical protein